MDATQYPKHLLPEKVSCFCLITFLLLSATPAPTLLTNIPLVFAGIYLSMSSATSILALSGKLIAPICFLLSYLASSLFSVNVLESLDALVSLFPPILVFILGVQCLSSPRLQAYLDRGFTTTTIVISSFLVIAYFVSPDASPNDLISWAGVRWLVVPNDVLLLVILLPFSLSLFIREIEPLWKCLALGGILLTVVSIILLGSRLGLLILTLEIALFIYYRSHKLIVPGVALVLIILLAVSHVFDRPIFDEMASLSLGNERMALWYIGLQSVGDNLLLGLGPGQYASLYDSSIAIAEIPEWMKVEKRSVAWIHSMPLESLVERGIAGAITTVYLLGVLYFFFWKKSVLSMVSRSPRNLALLTSYMAFLAAGIFELSMQRSWVQIFLALYCAFYFVDFNEGRTISKEDLAKDISHYRRRLPSLSFTILLFTVFFAGAYYSSQAKTQVPFVAYSVCNSIIPSKAKKSKERPEKVARCTRSATEKIMDDPSQFWEKAGYGWLRIKVGLVWWRLDNWIIFLLCGTLLGLFRMSEGLLLYLLNRRTSLEGL